MAKDSHKATEVELLPVRQRIAWIAAIWLLSVGAMALVSLAVRAILA